jgi:lipoprotein-anchoring transpeptidase ErfK/SrfK
MSAVLRRVLPTAAGLAVLMIVVASAPGALNCRLQGCPSGGYAAAPSITSAPPAPTPVALAITPAPDTRDVDPLAAVAISATNGTLEMVTMVNDTGRVIDGVTTPDNKVWKPMVPLGFGRTYKVTATGRGTDGVSRALESSFTTVVPGNQAAVQLTTTGNRKLIDGGIYGVGVVIVARFDEAIPDRAAAERALRVSANPPTIGAWNWVDDQTAHWRPEHYYNPGTEVKVAANVYGVTLGEDLYGQADSAVSFRIGDAHIAIADDRTKQVSVFENGKLLRTMPTSMGMGGSETVNGRTISFWTQPGVYTVMDKANPVIMDSSTYGLPINSRLGYRETISYATRISTDGIYLHQLEDTVWAQGNTNVSHGCLNLNAENARWFYDFSQPGDIVEVRNTGGAPLELWQNGDWSVPWLQWLKGSALT